MKKAEHFDWTEDMEKNFIELKAEFSDGGTQAYPDFDSEEPFILTMDWSALNIAGVLSQKHERGVDVSLLAGVESVVDMKNIILVQKGSY